MAQRYASPGGSGPEPCSQGSPCSLTAAVNNAVGGEVIVLPGAYDIGTGSLVLDDASLNVHGASGQSRPTIRGAPNVAPLVSITGVGATMSHLSLRQEGNGGIPSLSVAVNATVASTLSDLIITNTAATSTAARLANLVTLSSSVAHATSGDGITAFSAVGGPTLHNVTAWGGSGGIAAEGLATTVVATNTIAHGDGTDLFAGVGTITTMTGSNFATTSGTGSVPPSITNQTAAPILADPANGDFHQRPGSPTINAGLLQPLAGPTDFDGDNRVIGVQDIGADEYVPVPPTVSTGDPLAITTSGAQLTGSVNPKGQQTTYRFDYGLTPAYGSSTAPQSAGAGGSDVPVAADISGLAPGSIVNYRLVASNADGETLGGNRTLVVLTDPPPQPPTVSTGDPLAITTSGAQLTGTVNPNGQLTSYHFDYGLTPVYGSSTPAQSAGAGGSGVPVTADIGGLAPGSIVNYRLVASNADGETLGLNRTLVVLTDPPPLPPPPDLPPPDLPQPQPPQAETQVLPPVNLGGATGPAPAVTDIQLPPTVVVGEPITIEAQARDPDDPVNSIVVDFDDGPSVFAMSACRLSPRSRLFDNNRQTNFEVPYTFTTSGTHNVEVTLGSGDCGRARQTRTQTVQVNVAPAKTRAQGRLARYAVVIAGADCSGADAMPTRRTLKSMEKTTRCVLNETRRAGGLKALRQHSRLRKAAAVHNTYMRRGKFFAHQGPGEPSLAARLRKAKYRGGAGENLAAGSGEPLATPRGIVLGWMGSPLHRANVMEPRYYTVGIAIMAEMPLDPYRPGATWTAEFGTARR